MNGSLFRKLALALCLALGLSAAALAEDAAPADVQEYAVTVGDVRYTKELVQFSLNSLIDNFVFQGETVTPEDAQLLLDETIEHFVQLGVIDSKLKEQGLDQFTEDDLAYYRDYAQQTYETLWQGIYAQLKAENSSITDEQVSDWLNTHGYTMDMFYEDALGSARMGRAMDMYCQQTTFTTQELVEFYTERFVQPDREKYENDVKRYEDDLLAGGGETFFTPEGYRYVKHILLDIPEELKETLTQLAHQAEDADEERQEAYNALAEAAAGGEDIAPYKAAYDERVAALEAIGAEYEDTLRQSVPLLKDKTDEIYRRYKAGESFETLMIDYSIDSQHQKTSDPGYLFHPESENWAGAFREAAAALQKPGDISQPVVTTAGVHIICYMSDAPSGVHQLTEQEQQALEASLLQEKKLAKLGEMIEVWQQEYAVETHPEMLSLDEYTLITQSEEN